MASTSSIATIPRFRSSSSHSYLHPPRFLKFSSHLQENDPRRHRIFCGNNSDPSAAKMGVSQRLHLRAAAAAAVFLTSLAALGRRFGRRIEADLIEENGRKTTTKEETNIGLLWGRGTQEVDVHPPEVVRTKGSGSRVLSRVEKVLKLKSKPLLQCKKCQ
ncbi:hypothetical protein SASPL_131075 [Salvia splendens]|uniref:Uncharacterized protein n=1 Tax=Salvia splendens TaxID=180675 RepID=A0A8X8ZK97_SALSN|nr:hypothetical protein SASPL_131075 [Salvia splendens]